MIEFKLNGQPQSVDVDPNMPLLWLLRDHFNLTGTKFGCGIGMCGACTVSIEGAQTRSCQIRVGDLAGLSVETVENQVNEDGELSAVQAAWIAEQVPQCGYCQSGMIMAATSLLHENPNPSDDEIDAAIDNLCRCGTYARVRKAIHRAAEIMRSR